MCKRKEDSTETKTITNKVQNTQHKSTQGI